MKNFFCTHVFLGCLIKKINKLLKSGQIYRSGKPRCRTCKCNNGYLSCREYPPCPRPYVDANPNAPCGPRRCVCKCFYGLLKKLLVFCLIRPSTTTTNSRIRKS